MQIMPRALVFQPKISFGCNNYLLKCVSAWHVNYHITITSISCHCQRIILSAVMRYTSYNTQIFFAAKATYHFFDVPIHSTEDPSV